MSITDRPVQNTILFDENGNTVQFPLSGSTFSAATGLIPNGAKADNGLAVPLMVASGSTGLKVASVGTRPILGEYKAVFGLSNGAITTQSLFSLENPSGSLRNIVVKRLHVDGVLVGAVTSTVPFLYHAARTTSMPSGGNTLNVARRSISEPAPVGIARNGPTATAVSGSLWVGCSGVVMTAVGQMQPNVGSAGALNTDSEMNEIILQPGDGLVIKADPNTAAWRHYGFVFWQETN